MFKVIIAGGRDYIDYTKLCKVCDKMLSRNKKEEIEIVSGGARGADKLGETYARQREIPFKRFPAKWDKYGKSAGYKRNEEMAEYADALIAFWDGESKGTEHMINLAEKRGLKTAVIKY